MTRLNEEVIAELEQNLDNMKEIYKTAVIQLAELKTKVEIDELTKLLRRGAFMEKLQIAITTARSRGATLQVLMIDLDHFKRINDAYGHPQGDAVLTQLCDIIKDALGPQDFAGRYGGEEIIIALETDEHTALKTAERIRKSIAAQIFHHKPLPLFNKRRDIPSFLNRDEGFHVTVSIGVASTEVYGYDGSVLMLEADNSLYQAKRTGRNRVCVAETILKSAG